MLPMKTTFYSAAFHLCMHYCRCCGNIDVKCQRGRCLGSSLACRFQICSLTKKLFTRDEKAFEWGGCSYPDVNSWLNITSCRKSGIQYWAKALSHFWLGFFLCLFSFFIAWPSSFKILLQSLAALSTRFCPGRPNFRWMLKHKLYSETNVHQPIPSSVFPFYSVQCLGSKRLLSVNTVQMDCG